MSSSILTVRDDNGESSYGTSGFALLAVLIFASCVIFSLLYLRRCRRRALQQHVLPQYNQSGHHRALRIATAPSGMHGETVLIYDEKMNLLANSSASSNSPVPEIRVTFPDEEQQNGGAKTGRVVVLRISDSGSVGMEPLHKEPLPPYNSGDAERFHSLDLDRMGGLKEKHDPQPRYS